MKTNYNENEIKLSYDSQSMKGLIADAVGDVCGNNREVVEAAIKAGTLDQMVAKIQDKMIEYGCQETDVYNDTIVTGITEKLVWLVEHPYTAPTDEQIHDMVEKLVWNITRRFKGGQIVAVDRR